MYGGVYAGMTKSAADWTGVDDDFQFSSANIDDTVSASGGDFGGFIGLNWQNDQLVLGLEASYGAATADGTDQLDGAEGLDLSTEMKSIGSVRARVGYAAGQSLIYVTGGLAMGKNTQTWDEDGSEQLNIGPVELETNSGWVAGGGIEYAVTENISVRAEGLYYDFGSKSGTASGLEETDTFKVKQTATSALIGIAYHF